MMEKNYKLVFNYKEFLVMGKLNKNAVVAKEGMTAVGFSNTHLPQVSHIV